MDGKQVPGCKYEAGSGTTTREEGRGLLGHGLKELMVRPTYLDLEEKRGHSRKDEDVCDAGYRR